jgi:hypothetical protein
MRSNPYRVLVVIAVAALAMSSVALAAGSVTGTYATTIKSPSQLKGKWSLTLVKGGTYAVVWNGQVVARGKYSATPKTITFDHERGSGCTGAGTYAWAKAGRIVTFTRKKESISCQARAAVLAHRFTQVQ